MITVTLEVDTEAQAELFMEWFDGLGEQYYFQDAVVATDDEDDIIVSFMYDYEKRIIRGFSNKHEI